MPRLRVVGWNVAPVLMLDDGEQLEPVPVQPATIRAGAAWQAFVDGGWKEHLDRLREQVGAD
jgi:hypothetical protein